MKSLIAIGIDIGGHIKFSGNNIKFDIPNIIGFPNPVGWSEISLDKSWENNLILIEGENQYYIGELARNQSEVKRYLTTEGVIKKINDIFLVIKAFLPLISKKQEENEIVLGIGVPISTTTQRMKKLSSKLKGTFEVKIQNDATKEIIERTFNIKQTYILPESYGSYYDLISNTKEDVIINAIVICLDLHTEIVTVYGGDLIRKASRDIRDASLSVLTNKIALALEEDTGSIVNPNSILENIRNNSNQVVIAGRICSFGKVKEHYIRQISKEILDNILEVLKLLPLESKIDYYIIAGEAVDLFWNEIEMLLFQNMLIDDFDLDRVIKVEDPIFSNAKGFEAMIKRKLTLDQ